MQHRAGIFNTVYCKSTLEEVKKSESSLTVKQRIIASSAAASVTALCMTPMDVVKIRLQLQGRRKSADGLKGTLDALVKITQREGFFRLWSGLYVKLASTVPTTALYYTLYDHLLKDFQKKLKKYYGEDELSTKQWIAPIGAGILARNTAVAVACPIEVIRTKLQSEHIPLNKLWSAITFSIKTVGFRSFFVGLVPTWLRDIPFAGIYWVNVEVFKTALIDYYGKKETTFGISFFSAAASSAIASIVTAPMDLIKTRRQVSFGKCEKSMRMSTLQVYRDVLRKEGISTFFVGTVPRLIKVVPTCAIMLASYDLAKYFFAQQNIKK